MSPETKRLFCKIALSILVSTVIGYAIKAEKRIEDHIEANCFPSSN